MRQKSVPEKEPATQVVKNIRRATRRHFSAEDKIRIVLEGLRGEDSTPCRCGGRWKRSAFRAPPSTAGTICTRPVGRKPWTTDIPSQIFARWVTVQDFDRKSLRALRVLSLYASRLTCSHLSIKIAVAVILSDDLADLINAVGVGTSASHAIACLTVFQTRRQLDDLAIFIDERKHVSLLACKLCMCNAASSFDLS